MDLIDKKFDKFKENIYKLGFKPRQLKEMVETQALFEWSTETAVSLSVRDCSWIVQEDANEDCCSEDDKLP